MTTEELGSRFFAEQDRLRGGPAADLCDAGYCARIGGYPVMTRSDHDAFARAFYGAFDELHHVVEHLVADESSVAVRFRIVGTHTGSFWGIPATGRAIDVGAIAMLRCSDGRITALDAVFDEAGMLRQLGVMSQAT